MMQERPPTKRRLNALLDGRRWLIGTTVVSLLILALLVDSHYRWPPEKPTLRSRRRDDPFSVPIQMFERSSEPEPKSSANGRRPGAATTRATSTAADANHPRESAGARVQSNAPVSVPVVERSEDAFFQPRGAWLSGTIEPLLPDRAPGGFAPAELSGEPAR
jgi:hypothetical protein